MLNVISGLVISYYISHDVFSQRKVCFPTSKINKLRSWVGKNAKGRSEGQGKTRTWLLFLEYLAKGAMLFRKNDPQEGLGAAVAPPT